MTNENLRIAAVVHSRTVRDKNAEIRRLEIANEQLVKQYAELHLKYTIVSTLMRKFARLHSLARWSSEMKANKVDGKYPPRLRTLQEWDRFNKALVDKPWEVVTEP